MCGIGGIVYDQPERPVNRAMLDQMLSVMNHRGPDSAGFYVAPGVGLGIQRLSIIDLKTGDQPIANEDTTVTVVCNGEIYNFQELRDELVVKGHCFRTRSDCEVIVHLYEDLGVRCVERLRGMFGFALWDSRCRRLMLARDRLGIKPLLYRVTPNSVVFGSEIKSILMSENVERALDLQALHDVFSVGFVLSPKTFFRTIHRLLPGHYLLYQNGTVSLHRYWQPHFLTRADEAPHRGANEWAELLRAKLEESVHIHLRSDVPVGAWLSGGIDSSAVVSLMSRLLEHPVQTFTLAFENPALDEVRGRKLLADYLSSDLPNQQTVCTADDVRLLPQAVWHCEDPSMGGTEISRMLLAKMAAHHFKVVLTGEGSDELFGGYPWFKLHKLLRPVIPLPFSARRLLSQMLALRKRWQRASWVLATPVPLSLTGYKRLLGSEAWPLNVHLFSDTLQQQMIVESAREDAALPQDFEQWHPFTRLQYWELMVRLPDYILRHLDAASMAYSLEARVPFLDHELVELCAQIPPALKMRWLQEKHILRQALRGLLPPEILQRKKHSLAAPFRQWMRNLPEFAVELLSEQQIRDKGYFDHQVVGHMVQQHRAGNADYGRQLTGVVKVQLWDDLFQRGCQPTSY